ncbi:MAG TPA: hypothetical protein VNH11_27330 [Pirellulales bacterium]|nr:hypothetical protein [Pirellulales bacterium]
MIRKDLYEQLLAERQLAEIRSLRRPPERGCFGHKIDFRPGTRRHEAAQSEQRSVELRIRSSGLISIQDFGFEPLDSAVVAAWELGQPNINLANLHRLFPVIDGRANRRIAWHVPKFKIDAGVFQMPTPGECVGCEADVKHPFLDLRADRWSV